MPPPPEGIGLAVCAPLALRALEAIERPLPPDLALMARGLLAGEAGFGTGRLSAGCAAGACVVGGAAARAAAATLCGEPAWAGMDDWLLAEDPRRKIG